MNLESSPCSLGNIHVDRAAKTVSVWPSTWTFRKICLIRIRQIKDHVENTLGRIAVPTEVEIVTSLPKTRSGKIMRQVLKANELGVSPGDISTLEE